MLSETERSRVQISPGPPLFGNKKKKPLKRERLKNILLDPVYVGRPALIGVAVIDETLRYVDDETFNKCKELLDTKKDQKGMSVLTQLALKYDDRGMQWIFGRRYPQIYASIPI